MLTVNQLRQVAARSGARDIANVEIDVLLTYLLQLFTEKGLTEHLAFKAERCCGRWCSVRADAYPPISILRDARTFPSTI
jgi:hypothetical protein